MELCIREILGTVKTYFNPQETSWKVNLVGLRTYGVH